MQSWESVLIISFAALQESQIDQISALKQERLRDILMREGEKEREKARGWVGAEDKNRSRPQWAQWGGQQNAQIEETRVRESHGERREAEKA